MRGAECPASALTPGRPLPSVTRRHTPNGVTLKLRANSLMFFLALLNSVPPASVFAAGQNLVDAASRPSPFPPGAWSPSTCLMDRTCGAGDWSICSSPTAHPPARPSCRELWPSASPWPSFKCHCHAPSAPAAAWSARFSAQSRNSSTPSSTLRICSPTCAFVKVSCATATPSIGARGMLQPACASSSVPPSWSSPSIHHVHRHTSWDTSALQESVTFEQANRDSTGQKRSLLRRRGAGSLGPPPPAAGRAFRAGIIRAALLRRHHFAPIERLDRPGVVRIDLPKSVGLIL